MDDHVSHVPCSILLLALLEVLVAVSRGRAFFSAKFPLVAFPERQKNNCHLQQQANNGHDKLSQRGCVRPAGVPNAQSALARLPFSLSKLWTRGEPPDQALARASHRHQSGLGPLAVMSLDGPLPFSAVLQKSANASAPLAIGNHRPIRGVGIS